MKLVMLRIDKTRSCQANPSASHGFTLIELIIVIVVLGVLTSIAFLSVRGVRESGVVKSCNANAVTLLKAFEAYNIEKGFYPGYRQVGDDFTDSDVNQLVRDGYIRSNFTSTPEYRLSASLSTGGARVVGTMRIRTAKTCQAP